MSDDRNVVHLLHKRRQPVPVFHTWPILVSADVTLKEFTRGLKLAGIAVQVDPTTGRIFIQYDDFRPAA